MHAIEEVRLAFAAREEAQRAINEANRAIDEAHRAGRRAWPTSLADELGQRAGTKAHRVADEAIDAFDEVNDTYITVFEVFEEAIKKAYERGEKNH